MRRVVLSVALVAALAVVAGYVGTGRALAYGHADNPIAQVEISANCDNPSFPLCAPQPDGVGLGGVWAWAELDTATPGDSSGTIDFTFSGCGHTVGGGGPGVAGAHGTPGEGVWSTITDLGDAPEGAFPFFDPAKSYNAYYVLDFFPGAPPDQEFIAVVPASVGHYSWHPAPGASIQTQVAP